MSELASMSLHFACFSSKIGFFVDRLISIYIYRDFYYLNACGLSISLHVVRVNANFILLLYAYNLLLYTFY